MGWLWLAVIGLGAVAMLRLLGVAGAWLQLAAAALLVGGAGYALQQNASLGGHPVKTQAKAIERDPGLLALRSAIMPPDAANRLPLGAADDRLGNGDTRGAARLLIQAIDRRPRDAALWTRLGTVLAEHDGGQVSPAAHFAFRRAIQLAPHEPGPPFFLGLALIEGGDLPAARQAWIRALALTPQRAAYRGVIAERVALLDRFMATQAAVEAGGKAR